MRRLLQERESRLVREADSANARGGERTIERPDRVGSHPSPAPSPLVEKLTFWKWKILTLCHSLSPEGQ